MAPVKRVLLLNPPWPFPILRDAWCTSVSKAGYLWQPVDLLAQTGWLTRHGIAYRVIDAIAERLPPAACLRRAEDWDPDLVLVLTSPLSAPQDDALMAAMAPRRILVAAGEAASMDPAAWLAAHPRAHAVLSDYTAPSLARFALGHRQDLDGLHVRGDTPRPAARAGTGTFRLPVPDHAAFPPQRYRMPMLGGARFATLVTDIGCPHRCAFCNSSATGHRLRDLDDVAADVDAIRRLGVPHVFVKDMSFGSVRAHAEAVCDLLARAGLSWHAYARADDLDDALVRRMAASGCRLLQFGFESGDPALRRAYGKRMDDEVAAAAVAACRAAGVKVGGHFVLGMPGESASSLLRTLQVARRLRPDYVSFNIATLRQGSAFARTRADALAPSAGRGLLAARDLMYLAYYLDPAWIRRALRDAGARGLPDLVASGLGLLRMLGRPGRERAWLRRLRTPPAAGGRSDPE